MKVKDSSSTRGILNATEGKRKFTLHRFEPDVILQPFVEHYWTVHYELEAPYYQKILSFPSLNLSFELDDKGSRALIYGVPKRTFVRELKGSGRVLGVKFRPGGFFPFYKRHIAMLTGAVIPAVTLFDDEIERCLVDVLSAEDDEAMAKRAEQFLLGTIPARDTQAELAASIVQIAMDDRQICKVEQLSERIGLPVRQIQRLFHKYVGVSPKWVVKRFRLQEAAERLAQEETLQWADLAVQLGYFDQAHFIKDFKSIVGQSPAAYKNNLVQYQ